MAKTHDTQDQSLEETLNKTDFGTIINDNKKNILIAGLVLVIGIFAFSFYAQSVNSKMNLGLANAHDFKVNVIDAFTTKKTKSDEFIKQMEQMPSSIRGEVSILPSVLLATKTLAQDNKKQAAHDILSRWLSNFSEGSFAHFYTSFNLSQVLIDLGKNEEAVKQLESLKRSSIDLLKSKILLDLARVQLGLKKNTEAKENLNIIVKDYEGSVESKEAAALIYSIKK